MVFSSLPVYLDPPNWQQHNDHQQGIGGSENPQLPPPPPHVGAGGGTVTIRPSSMADRARLAKVPQPEAALKCPRCDSTNTKFCYFNNYSLSQPRHFCKACRRYWTRGGALRNVPVGGGCRRNKKNKSSTSSKTPASTQKQAEVITAHNLPQQTPHLPFMASLQSFSQYGLGNIGLNYGGSGQADIGFPLFEPSNGLYPFGSEGIEASSSSMVGESQFLGSMSSSSRVSQLAPPMKTENNNNKGLNPSRPQLGISENNQYWGGNSWTDISANHLL
ncbi:hypothetical protein E1A91_A03G055300v1 [Gossypium mustelinum]|uniref:Dof zinc finger protein n=1 Tax=Gossypium mustelinum TaxID=34275 RepID=A0A5D2ZV74_GOSMU|nr:hypothetical protein E1A91_A03G055300v1 [Gossypium mustelinum]